MLKHGDIIEKLDPLQKVAIVASAFGSGPFEEAGLPAVGIASLEELGRREGISYGSAIRSWDPELVGRMTEELVCGEDGEGARLFMTPDLKTVVDPLEDGLSEDPYLNGMFGAEVVRAVRAVGGAAGMSRLSVDRKEISYLDRKEDVAAIHDLVTKPFLLAVSEGPCDAVFVEPARIGMGYYDTNRVLFNDVLNGTFGKDVFAIGVGETSSADAVKLLRGKATVGGAKLPLERATRRYAQLAAYEAEGSVSHRDVEESVRDGSAMDDEKLDALLDEILDFVFRLRAAKIGKPKRKAPAEVVEDKPAEVAEEAPAEVAEEPPAEVTEEAPAEVAEEKPAEVAEETPAEVTEEAPAEVAEEAPAEVAEEAEEPHEYEEFEPVGDDARRKLAEECVVLLKNEKILPLPAGAAIAVLGEAYGDLSLLGEKFRIVGQAAGYERAADRSDALIPEAVRATNEADAVLVFLYPDATGRNIAMPANRIALLDALKRAKKKVIALVCGDIPVDMSFDRSVAATLAVPADGRFAGDALARVLSGEVNPSGRLVRTAYDDADAYFSAYRENRDAGRMRVGSFVGYRRYLTAGEKVRYPFGSGIGYSKFSYSRLRIEGDVLSFTLKNIGKYDGSEVVEIYIGAPSVSRVTPVKQLRAFRKVFLRAGESRQVVFDLPASSFATFDYRLYADNVETGNYRIYVGPSPNDIRLQGRRYLEGVKRAPLPEKNADYFPDGDYIDVSNVGRESRMNKDADTAPERLKQIRKAALYAMPAFAFLFFLMMTILILSYTLDYALLSVVGMRTMEWILYIAAILVFAALPLIGSLNRKRVFRVRTIALIASPFLLFTSFILGALLAAGDGGDGEMIALRIVSCFAVGAPIAAVVGFFVDRELWKTKTGANRWAKFYFERKRDERMTPEAEFEEAFRTAEIARETAAAAAKDEDTAPVVLDVPQFYDKKLTYGQLISDCRKFAEERGLLVGEDLLRNWMAALSATQLLLVPAGDGAALCTAVAEYFGKKPYLDNAEQYRRYEDLFAVWKQNGRANIPTNFASALGIARHESAFLHTVLIRHVDLASLETLFLPIADVLARRKTALPFPGDKTVLLPPNVVIVAEVETERLSEIPVSIAEVAAVLSPVCGKTEPSPKKTVVQTVGFERFTAMRQSVRDDHPLGEASWKKVDLLDERCKSAHIGNHLWNRMELHASVVSACGGDEVEALDGALAQELVPWLKGMWVDDVCDGTISQALADLFGESYSLSGEFLKEDPAGEEEA